MADAKIKEVNVDNIRSSYLEQFRGSKLFKLNLQNDLWTSIVFPNLPYNFEMMMSDIEWPKKAGKNPNGTLFTSPQEIDENSADDIGLQCFNSSKFGGKKSGLKMTMNPRAYENFNSIDDYYSHMLLEDSVNLRGSDIDVKSIKSHNDRMAKQNANVVQAITTYVTRSLTAIEPLVQMVGGDNASAAIGKVRKAIHTANQLAYSNVEDWLNAQSSVEKDKGDNKVYQQKKDAERERDMAQKASNLFACISISDMPSGVDKNAFLIQVAEEMQNVDTDRRLRDFINRFTTFGNVSGFDRFWATSGNKAAPLSSAQIKASGFRATESMLEPDVANALFEDSDDYDSVPENNENINYDKIHQDLFNALSSAMDEAIGPRDSWKVMKDVANQMKILKENADKTILERIKLVCKTGGQKSIFTHPKVANGLENMWARYSAELQNRIDNRIAQLTGTSGSRESGSASMVEDFLRTTYPQIISVLLTYRCVFAQIAEQYNRGYIPEYSDDDMEEIVQSMDGRYTARLMVVLRAFDAVNGETN